ncbi:MAG: hypothetical protein HDR02_17930 [Lachnospiraceae bacterium]|nr:hypothetical protein [Lachnospiraceae bacterium]
MKALKDFVPIRISGMSCFDNSITSLVNWERKEYNRAFMYSWKFRFTNEGFSEDSIGNVMTRTYRLSLEKKDEQDIQKVYQIIRDELEIDHVVLVKGDEFYCPWMYNYGKNHEHEHVYLITGETEDGFKCADTMPLVDDESISFEEFEKGYFSLYVYHAEDYHPKNEIGGGDYLKKCVFEYQILKNVNLQEMDILLVHIENTSMIDLFEEKENVWDTTLYKYFERMYGGRIQFLEFMSRIANGETIVLHFIEKMEEVVEEWSLVPTLIAKAFIQKRDMEKIRGTLVLHLRKAIELEKVLYREMMDEQCYTGAEMALMQENLPQVFVDLEPYKRNKELYFDEKHIVTYKEIPVNQIWNVGDMKFDFQIYGKYDCICCDEQKIKVIPNKYRYIMILGYAIYGDQVDDFTIVYSDDSEQKMMVEFSDWSYDPRHGFITAWEGDCKSLDDGKRYRGKIYAKKYRLPSGDYDMEALVLPKNAKSRIYAITLA